MLACAPSKVPNLLQRQSQPTKVILAELEDALRSVAFLEWTLLHELFLDIARPGRSIHRMTLCSTAPAAPPAGANSSTSCRTCGHLENPWLTEYCRSERPTDVETDSAHSADAAS
jgi:hypothetical protein